MFPLRSSVRVKCCAWSSGVVPLPGLPCRPSKAQPMASRLSSEWLASAAPGIFPFCLSAHLAKSGNSFSSVALL